MKKMMKQILAVLLVTVMIVPLAGCGSNGNSTDDNSSSNSDNQVTDTNDNDNNVVEDNNGSEDEVITLKIYAQYSDDDTKIPYDYAVQELAKEYPNVKLELDVQAQDDGQKLQTYAATGKLPDIFQIGLSQINAFKESGNILVLDDYVKSTGFEDKLNEANKNLLYVDDGHAYAFPYAGNEMVLWYYNKALFEQHNVKVPETYDELLEAVEKFNEVDIVPLSVFAKEKWICVALYDAFATRLEPKGVLKLDKGEASAEEPAYVEAATKLQALVEAGLLAKGATNMNYDQSRALFYEGKAAMFLNGQWEIEDSTNALGENADWMWYPTYAENPDAKYAVSGSGAPGGYAVSPYSEHKDLAAEVAAFIALKYAEAKYIYRSNPILAAKIDPSWEPEKEMSPMMQKLVDELDNITSYSVFDWGLSNPKVKVALEDQAQFILTPGYTAEEFTEALDSEMKRIFE